MERREPLDALLVAVPEATGSALYGMLDVLSAAGIVWPALVGDGPETPLIRPRILAPDPGPLTCMNRIPVVPDLDLGEDPQPDLVILPEIWLRPEESIAGRYPALIEWLRRTYRRGATIYSACSGVVILAESGLLSGREATSHWAYEELFRRQYPDVTFRAAPNLVYAERSGRIVTAGGTTSWHDLAIHIIARHCGPGEALRIAKVYLLKWHGEGQSPYTPLIRRHHHADAAVRACEDWLKANFRGDNPVGRAVARSGVPERSIKRRFKEATGTTLIEYVQRLRIEEAKRLLETGDLPVDAISAEVGYEDPAFFRQLFRRHTGLTPAEYRRMFAPFAGAAPPPAISAGSAARR
jgi:transcriptional regulator GlxA family with amidase domain